MVSESQLRTLYSQRLEGQTPGRQGCVSPDQLAALVLGRGSERRRLTTVDHVMACRYCHGDFALLQAAVTASQTVDSAD